jgi:hypothetical protein
VVSATGLDIRAHSASLCCRVTYVRLFCLIAFAALVLAPTAGAGHNGDAHAGMRLDWSLPDGPTRTHSDIAFWGDIGVAGNYDGFRVFNRQTHQLYVSYLCRGPQDDVSLWQYNGRLLLFLSVDRPQINGATTCGQSNSTDTTASDPNGWEGIRIFDITDPGSPVYLHAVRTDCGSHTHTLVPDLGNGRLLLYVSSYPIGSNNIGGVCQPPFGKISIVSVPLDAPETASVLAQPTISAPAYSGAVGCHDITVFLAIHKAAASCMSEGQLWDISDPANPATQSAVHIDNASVWFWHSGEFTWDGQYVVFDDEGTGNCSSSSNGRIWIYRVSDAAFQSSYMIPRPQGSEYCSVHNGNVVPVAGKYLLVAAWYAGGTSVIDFTTPSAPHEIAYYDAVVGRGAADTWSSYWYNGTIYANDIARGVDAFKLISATNRVGATWDYLNAQTQENLVGFSTPPSFAGWR